MKGHVLHSYFVFVVSSAKAVVEFLHLTSEMAAAKCVVDYLESRINAPASFVGRRRYVLQKVDLKSS